MGDYLNQWLLFVDNQLSHEATEFLKLGLYSKIHRYFSEIDMRTTPSKLYHLLLEHHEQQSESEVLRVFVHVLKGLGGSLRGNFVVKTGLSEYKLKDPGKLDIETEASTEFRFFQCLLQILTKVRKDIMLSDRVKTKLSKVLKINASHFDHLPSLFIVLYQRGFIAAGETSHLQNVLKNYENKADVDKHVVRQCLEILNRYHSSSNIPQLLSPSDASSDPASAVDTDPDSDGRRWRRSKQQPTRQHHPASGNEMDRLLGGSGGAGRTSCTFKFCCRFTCSLAVVVVLLTIGMILVNFLKLKAAFDCSENAQYPVILSNSTIKGGEFSSCLSEVTMKFRERLDHNIPISSYKVSCRHLVMYHEPIRLQKPFNDLENEVLPVYDCSINSCYFAKGLSAEVSVSVNASNSTIATISVCWSTLESDRVHFLSIDDIPPPKDKDCHIVLHKNETENGTEFKNTVLIKNSIPSYYNVEIRVVGEVTSLWYNFTSERSFYNQSDFGKAPDCTINDSVPKCDIQLSGEACVMLHADPEPNAINASSYKVALTGQKRHGEKWKRDAFIALWTLSSVFFALSIILIIISVLLCKKEV